MTAEPVTASIWSDAVFSPVPVRNAFEVTVERLASAIRLGVLAAGDRLPSERDLADQLGVSRMTLREAIKALREVGLVESRRGRSGGTFVRSAQTSPAARRRPPRQIGRSMGAHLQDALDMRRIVEPGAAELAASRSPNRREVDTVRRCLVQSRSARSDTRRVADSRLHLAIAEAAGSPSLTSAVAQVQLTLDELLRAIPVLAANIAHSDDQHEQIVEAIAHGNAELARASMCEHVDATAALLIGLIG